MPSNDLSPSSLLESSRTGHRYEGEADAGGDDAGQEGDDGEWSGE
jgi:hypothetical protein